MRSSILIYYQPSFHENHILRTLAKTILFKLYFFLESLNLFYKEGKNVSKVYFVSTLNLRLKVPEKCKSLEITLINLGWENAPRLMKEDKICIWKILTVFLLFLGLGWSNGSVWVHWDPSLKYPQGKLWIFFWALWMGDLQITWRNLPKKICKI